MKKEETKSAPDDIEPVETRRWTGKPVNQYGLDGKFIRRFDSQAEAIRTLGIKGGTLAKCLKGHARSAKGYQWRYAE
jgi:hypothetical protein